MKKGLTTEEAKRRLSQFGPNIIPTTEELSWIKLLFSQFTNILNLILIIAAILAFILGDRLDGWFIVTVVLLNSLFGFLQEFRAHRSIAALKDLLITEARVLRDGMEAVIQTQNLVPGDIVILTEGERIPADGKLIHGTHLEVDEAVLTGESIPVLKQVKKGEGDLFMSTTIVSGRGRMEVTQTGLSTRFGKIAQTLTEIREEKTPLQIQLAVLGRNLAFGIAVVGIAIIVVGVFQEREFFSILLTGISVAVAAIPEGLPVVITIALALGMERMAGKKAIVRKLASIEALGAVQVLLIDKTGTLTRNEMRVKKVWLEAKISPFLLRACVLGNSASLIKKEDDQDSYDVVGDKTDGALLLWARGELGDNFETFVKEGRVVDEYAFDPAAKTITVIWENLGDGKRYTLVRGAPEKILEQTKLASLKREYITRAFEGYAKEGLRVISFGYKKHDAEHLTFLGFVGIYDPPRVEAKDAVRLARQGGIRTVMVTGDNERTAEAIAREVGLIEEDEDIVTGEALEKMTDNELDSILLKTRIFARVRPQDKLRITERYQKIGFIVGVTGDGVNDALALKKANVGVAMGQTGTDVAKEASDMVITDDNFATIVRAVEEGRTIYDNIVKATVYLLSCNLAEIGTIFFAVIAGLPLPLLPTQILWMNLVTDSLPALALASDTKDPLVLKRLPRETTSYILNAQVLKFLFTSGLIMTIFTVSAFYLMLRIVGEPMARTTAFTLLVGLQMIQAFVVRGFNKNPFTNKFLVIGVAITILLQILILSVPVLRTIFHISIF